MKEYEILVERINPCGGDAHAQKDSMRNAKVPKPMSKKMRRIR